MKTKTNILRGVRIGLACIFFAGITLLFMGIGADWWGWMADIQFLPSTLRVIGSATLLNIGILAGLVGLTLVFGRIYCSVICPLGVFQDVIIWLRRQYGLIADRISAGKRSSGDKGRQHLRENPILKKAVKHFEFNPEHKIARYGFLILTVAAMIIGMQVFVALIAPYSSYGRIVRGVVGITDGSPLPLVATGLAMLLVITACSLLAGRVWCNTICPVGTVLGLLSRFSLLKVSIDEDKCTGCGRCVRGCKASCIDGINHTIDYSRCVNCFDCIGRCSGSAITYGIRRGRGNAKVREEKPGEGVSRRQFLSTGAVIAAGTLAAGPARAAGQGGFAGIIDKQIPERSARILPPGALNASHLQDKCTSCQLCIAACPNDVLRPSTDLAHFLQPEAGYEKGYCRPECVKCSEVCPTGAILPVTVEQKTLVKIGTARVDLDKCLNGCGNCARHCPTGAIRMVKVEGYSHPMPVVVEDVCIGCGACEYLCPVRPLSAIKVDGVSNQTTD